MEAQKFQATDYLIKPFTVDDLLACVRRYAIPE